MPSLFSGELVALFDDDDVDEVKQERNEVDKLSLLLFCFSYCFSNFADSDKNLCLLESRTFITDAGSSTIYGVYRVSTGKL